MVCMKAYETSATVDEQGLVHVHGVPFAPGTEVEVMLREKAAAGTGSTAAETEEAPACTRDLFAALDKARNTESVGPLRREELYDRKVLR
jgi:hypothetical protein